MTNPDVVNEFCEHSSSFSKHPNKTGHCPFRMLSYDVEHTLMES